MKMYSRFSPYRWRVFRRLRYGRGRGVHSPKGYAMILSLIRPYAIYYHFEQYPKLFASPLSWALLRMEVCTKSSNISGKTVSISTLIYGAKLLKSKETDYKRHTYIRSVESGSTFHANSGATQSAFALEGMRVETGRHRLHVQSQFANKLQHLRLFGVPTTQQHR